MMELVMRIVRHDTAEGQPLMRVWKRIELDFVHGVAQLTQRLYEHFGGKIGG
ncbi:hypothetical protein D3C86_1779180 [compost metagenome]